MGVVEGESGALTLVGILADGMGGLSNGDYASWVLCDSVRQQVLEGKVSPKNLAMGIIKANKEIYTHSQQEEEKSGTTGTLVTLNLQTGKYLNLHIGDSRMYVLRGDGGEVEKVTEDHTAYNKYLKETPEKLESMGNKEKEKLKSRLTRCIGISPEIMLDINEGYVGSGDAILLASDGFWHGVESSESWEMLMNGKQGVLEELSSKFITQCNESDNQTAVFVKLTTEGK